LQLLVPLDELIGELAAPENNNNAPRMVFTRLADHNCGRAKARGKRQHQARSSGRQTKRADSPTDSARQSPLEIW
jgi:hypothetical protein